MKILNADQYISERIKVQPITNAELKKAAIDKELHEINRELHEHKLKQGDIVYYENIPHMVIMEEHLYKQVLVANSLLRYDCTRGVIACKDNIGASPGFMLVSDYDSESLKCKTAILDIQKVYRGPININKSTDMKQLICVDNLKQLEKDFTLIFDKGKWL